MEFKLAHLKNTIRAVLNNFIEQKLKKVPTRKRTKEDNKMQSAKHEVLRLLNKWIDEWEKSKDFTTLRTLLEQGRTNGHLTNELLILALTHPMQAFFNSNDMPFFQSTLEAIQKSTMRVPEAEATAGATKPDWLPTNYRIVAKGSKRPRATTENDSGESKESKESKESEESDTSTLPPPSPLENIDTRNELIGEEVNMRWSTSVGRQVGVVQSKAPDSGKVVVRFPDGDQKAYLEDDVRKALKRKRDARHRSEDIVLRVHHLLSHLSFA